ncbi:hypothetical protein H6F42_05800 [Pseudanabaena sp. FACHB-1998]|uniref:hypothetical protein n=1 Tax=Pseudanabaena sp. FACHB-1998 TaxID=2692858 RepID=UPI001681BD53|nr:hypothetical protein [Pseudanabaena sp. FACHB-1998]MBD2176429.1 hypothetical protein [Pseudanabaena sp. FACHB-1998]
MPSAPLKYLRLDIPIDVSHNIILEGLDAWFDLELISEIDWQWRNTNRSVNRLKVVAIQTDDILDGLNLWLEMGLINDDQVRLIAKTRFVSEISVESPESATPPKNSPISRSNRPAANLSGSRLTRSPQAPPKPIPPKTIQPPSKVAQTVRSLISEFSTMWLLFLGVFLVVVSSGLLAASQWNNFDAQGQYLLLFAYTLGFFGVSFWTSKNERLRLTTRALQLVALLLVPANFWAIDGLRVLTNPAGMGLGLIAGGLLSGIAIFLLQTSFLFREAQEINADSQKRKRTRRQLSQISIATILILSWLHLGWLISPYYPLIAVYLGIGAIAISTFLNRDQGLNTADSSTFPLALITGAYSTVLLVSRALLFANVSIFKLGLAFGICGWVLVQITNKTERLASASLSKSELTTGANSPSVLSFQKNLGQILLGLGWLVSVWDQYPWQAFTVSLLVLWILCDRLFKHEAPQDLTYLFFWGLQLLWLGKRLIPEVWGGQTFKQLLALFQTNSEITLLGVLLFPYVILFLGIAAAYRDRQKPTLALRGELLALGFGVTLTCLSFPNLYTLTTNLTLSAITLLVVQARRSPTSKDLSSLVYCAHIVSLIAMSLGIYLFTAVSSIFVWSGFLLGIMLLEWTAVLAIGKFTLQAVSLGEGLRGDGASPPPQSLPQRERGENPRSQSLSQKERKENPHLQAWRDSAWHIGASLAALSYILLWNAAIEGQRLGQRFGSSELLINSSYWGVAWLSVPLSLTFLGTWREFADRDLAIKLSIAGLAIAQFLTWTDDSSRLIGLGVAFALMLVNTRRNESLLTTFNTVGYGLLFIAAMLWRFKVGDGQIAQFTFGITGLIVSVLLLYVLNHWLKYRRDRHVADLNLPLNQSYAQAFDIWAAFLSAALLILQSFLAISFFAFNSNNQLDQLFTNLLPSTVLVTLGLGYRVWQSTTLSPPFWTEWGIAWSIELLTSGIIAVFNGSAIELAIANLALGFITQLLGDWWMQRTGDGTNRGEYPRSWDIVPLIYGAMGSLFRIGSFSGLTGLFSLSTSLIGIGIGRRASQSNPLFKALTYLSMVVATFSAYELLFYQMVTSSQGGSLGDGLVILAVLGCAIAYAYQIFTDWIGQYLRLSIREVSISAHLHWTASVIFLLSGSFCNPSSTGGAIGGSLAIALAVYAITQGRSPLYKGGTGQVALSKGDLGESDLWIYTGLTTAIGAIAYFLFFAFPNPWLIGNVIQPYGAAIACVISLLLYQPPWEEWGWDEEPWHNFALVLPLVLVFVTQTQVAAPCLLIVGLFYTIYAKIREQIRFTYITLFLWDWAILTNLQVLDLSSSLRFLINICVFGFSGLYFAQVEPNLQSVHTKALRHTLRSLLSGGMGLIAFLYSFSDPSVAFTTWILSFAFIVTGLSFRIRAYLFMGTLTFILLVLTQAVILVTQYSFLMWALGIFAGIGFILVAANFEVRRDRIMALFRDVAIELETWE